MRFYIEIPYKEKERAENILGKKVPYDFRQECNYVDTSAEFEKIKHLDGALQENRNETIRYTSSPEQEFKLVLEQAGLVIDGLPIMDGKKRRVQLQGKGPKNRSGEYHGFLDGRPAGRYKNYLTGVKENWSYQGKIEGSLKVNKAEIAQKNYDRFVEKESDFRDVVKKAKSIWDSIDSEEMPKNHAYLTKKGIKLHGGRISNKGLVVLPLRNTSYQLTNLQFINEDGEKKFLSGGRIMGSFFQIGFINERSTIVICEGFSTGATLNELLNHPVICAINSANLVDVTAAIREKYPHNKIVIAADNDIDIPEDKGGNAGMKKATEAAKGIEKCSIAFPEFLPGEKGTDWNDFEKLKGIDASLEALKGQGIKAKRKRKSIV